MPIATKPERLLPELSDSKQHLFQEGYRCAVSEQTYHRWRNQYGGMKSAEAKRLKELEAENARLKRIMANKDLEIDMLKEIASGNW